MKLFELEAVLSLDTNNFATGVAGATSEGKTLAEKLGADADSIKSAFEGAFSISIGQLMADGFKQALGAAWEFTTGSIEAASNLEEIQHVVDTIFADKAGDFNTWASGAKEAFGMGELAAKSYASSIASVLSPETRGFDADEIYGMSTALTQLIGDIASFKNMSFDEVFTMLMSGLRGETESIERLGLDMRVATMAAFAGTDEKGWKAMSDYEQTMARYQYIMQSTAAMHGDFAETEGSYANQMRLFNENITELQVTLGQKLLPVMTELVTLVNEIISPAKSADEAMDDVSATLASAYENIETTTKSAYTLISALEYMESQGVDTAEEQLTWNTLLSELSSTLPGVESLINSTTGDINGGTAALRNYVEAWSNAETSAAESAAQLEAQTIIDEQTAKAAQELAGINAEWAKVGTSREDIAALYEEARRHLGLAENTGQGHIWGELVTAALSGDEVAHAIAERLSQFDSVDAGITDREMALAQMVAQNEILYEKMAQMFPEQKKVTTHGELVTFDSGPLSAEVTSAIASAVAAAIGNIHITVEGEVDMDGQKVGNLVLPTVALGLRRQSLMSTYSGKK